jgi:HEAT repeat protein
VENYLVEMGNPAIPELLIYLDSPQAQIRERICYVLGMIGDSAASPKLRLLLKDSDTNVVAEASMAMRRIGAR